MVVIRLARAGAKKRPFYHIVVADQRYQLGGRYIEKVGLYNPVARGGEERVRIDRNKVAEWVARGAQPSTRVATLVKQWDASAAERSAAAA